MRSELPEELSHIPEYYQKYDVRKPPVQYVENKLDEILGEIFSIRRKLEKTFSRNDLLAYDRILMRHLTHETLIPKMKQGVELDYNFLS